MAVYDPEGISLMVHAEERQSDERKVVRSLQMSGLSLGAYLLTISSIGFADQCFAEGEMTLTYRARSHAN